MYPEVLDMLDKALREEFPNLRPGNNGSFFFYSGTSYQKINAADITSFITC